MKNKKGFTLVELLAVIAILAILVIIALPNVINMYNKAQKQTFLTEARNVYREAEKKFLANSISGKNTKVINSEDSSKLDMNGKKLQYCVVLNNSGKVTDMKVSNGKWVASLNGKSIDELTIDDLEDGNLDDYECVNATAESCFIYEDSFEFDGEIVPVVNVEDVDKCKNYLVSEKTHFFSEDMATSLCTYGFYSGDNITLQDLIIYGFVSKNDYGTAGLNVKYVEDKSIKVNDVNKCKSYFTSNYGDLSDEDITNLCNGNKMDNGSTLKAVIVNGAIPASEYDNIGLSISFVSESNLNSGISITGYNASCGTDVVIPSKISGKKVVSIGKVAFMSNCGIDKSMSNSFSNDYKIKFLDYNASENYSINKVDVPSSCAGITSLTIPNTVRVISFAAFYRNELSEVIIPSSVKYIGILSFGFNNINTVIYNGNESDISFGNCPFYNNYNYDGMNKYCRINS